MKVCPMCGTAYRDYIDFCFNDGAVLEAMPADYDGPATEVPAASFATSDDEAVETAAVAAMVDPGLAEIDNLPVDDEEPTQHSDPVPTDDLTVPREPIEAASSIESAPTEPFVRRPAGVDEADFDPHVPVLPPGESAAFAHTERTETTAGGSADGEWNDSHTEVRAPIGDDVDATVATVVPAPAEPLLRAAPPDFDDIEPSDDEDTPVLQEPVIAAAPPLPGPGAEFDSDAIQTVVPDGSLTTDESHEPAPIGPGPTLAPAPPPVPNSLGQTLPIHEGRTPPQAGGRPVPLSTTSATAHTASHTAPVSPRPSATPTLPAVMLRGPEDDLPPPPPPTQAGPAGVWVVLAGAFAVGVAIVGLLVLGGVAVNLLTSSGDANVQEQAHLPPPAPNEPLPPVEVGDLGLEDDEDDALVADDLEEPGSAPSGMLPGGEEDPAASKARESNSISVVTSLNRASDGTGQRPILFESVPPNALVLLEGHTPFRTPSEVRLNVGERYTYTMKYPGYDPVQSNFMVMRGSGVLRRTERLVRTPSAAPTREGPIVFGPQGCRLRVDGTLMESEDIVGGTKIDEATGRPSVYLPFQLRGRVLSGGERLYMFQVVADDNSPDGCEGYDPVAIRYRGQASIVLK